VARTSKKRAQQLKHDKFRDATMRGFDRLGHQLEGRRRTVLYIVGGLIALAVIFGLYRTWSNSRAEKASLALGKAIQIASARLDSDPALPGATGPSFPTERERAQRAVEEFQKVAAEYGSPHRELAKYFAAVNQLQVDRAKGLEELAALTKNDNDEVAARARFALAQAKESPAPGEDKERSREEAVALYQELLKDKNQIIPADAINLRIASIYERQGRRDEASDILFRIVEEDRKAREKGGRKPTAQSETAEKAAAKLKTLNPERYAQLPPDDTDLPLPVGGQ
jgi:tetratricopeptide (TPR) repeat protein